MHTVHENKMSGARFFSDHYPHIKKLLAEFVHAHRRAKRSDEATRVHDALEVLELGCKILHTSMFVVGAKPVSISQGGAVAFLDFAANLQTVLANGNAKQKSAAEAIGAHIEYFRERVPHEKLALNALDNTDALYLRDCVINCVHPVVENILDYRWTSEDPRLMESFVDSMNADATVTPDAKTLMRDVLSLDGWCSPQKALLLYNLIREHKPLTVVEIGIYGGRSIVPIAAALRDNRAGEVWGIETWSGAGATSHRTSIYNDFVWMSTDFSSIKRDFLTFVLANQLQDIIRIIEAPSDRCGGMFDRIDFLHIDGNHSTYAAAKDVVTFLPKVPSGGIIVFDDIDWPTTAAGLEILRDTCHLIGVVPNIVAETTPGCAAFRKI